MTVCLDKLECFKRGTMQKKVGCSQELKNGSISYCKHPNENTTIIRRDRVLVTKFGLTKLTWATFLVTTFPRNNIVARNFMRFAAIDIKPDKSPLETEPVAHDNNKI